jgi:hypothetical protein
MLARLIGVRCRLFWRTVLLIAGLAVAGCGVAARHGPEPGGPGGPGAPVARSTTSGAAGANWHVVRGGRLRSVVVLDPQSGGRFAPPPAWAKPKLTGVQVWSESFLGGDRATPRPIPPYISYQFGLLTMPPSVTDVPAWGYSSQPGPCPFPEGGAPLPSRTASPSPSPSPRGRCIEWTFINATNASNPAGTWQRLNPPSPSPSPTPVTVIALHSGGFVSSDLQHFSPGLLVLQGPLSTIRWTFTAATCSIRLHWFLPPQSAQGPARAACPWRQEFSLTVVNDFTSRGRVFSVIGGYVAHRMGDLVRAILADGRTWIYDAQDADGAWLFAVQRCGDFGGTALRAVEEISPAGKVIAHLAIPAAEHPVTAAACTS